MTVAASSAQSAPQAQCSAPVCQRWLAVVLPALLVAPRKARWRVRSLTSATERRLSQLFADMRGRSDFALINQRQILHFDFWRGRASEQGSARPTQLFVCKDILVICFFSKRILAKAT